MLCDRLHAWLLTQSGLRTLPPSFIARRRAGRVSDNEGSGLNPFNKVGWDTVFVFALVHRGSAVGFLLLQRFSEDRAVELCHLNIRS